MKSWITILVILCSLCSSHSIVAQQVSDSAVVESITLAELRDHMYFLASDFLGGRVVGEAGYELAVQYSATQFLAAGLEPLGTQASGIDGFLQTVPLARTNAPEPPDFTMNVGGSEHSFRPDIDYRLLLAGRAHNSGLTLPLVFAGYGIEEPDYGWDDFEGLEVEDKYIVMLNGAPTREGQPVLPDEIHERYHGLDNLSTKLISVMGKNPAGIMLIADSALLDVWETVRGPGYEGYHYSLSDNQGAPQIGSESMPSILIIKPAVAEAMFSGQAYNPMSIETGGVSGISRFELNEAQVHTAFGSIQSDVVETWNVVGIVRGTDPALADEYVTLGAHLDHVPGQEIHNGADDNASGSIGVMEVAEAVAMAPPRRSVIFILYAAEEVGLYGSKYFVEHSPVPVDQIIANVNLDMIGRTAPENEETRAHIIVAPEGNSTELLGLVNEMNEANSRWPLKHVEGISIGSSDHASFLSAGIPAVFFFSGEHVDLHTPTDDADRIEFDKMKALSQLVLDVVLELGNRGEPLG